MRRRFSLLALLVAVALFPAAIHAGDKGAKLRVVIIDGQNNHTWKATTPVLKKELEDSGRFTVDVATSPQLPRLDEPERPQKPKNEDDEKALAKYKEAMVKYAEAMEKYKAALPKYLPERKAAEEAFDAWRIDFDKYDVVVSNFNGTDRNGKDFSRQSWPKAINDALEGRLKSGKIGLVIVHAANNAFGGWKEYNLMIGMGWRGNSFGDRLTVDEQGKEVRVPKGQGPGAGHGAYHAFRVTVRDTSHPVTKGMPTEWMHAGDELYHGMRGPAENIRLLATAFDDKKSGGTGENEPMIWTVSYGKGRVFHTPMGHDANSMRCVGFTATLQRGTEWAATGSVTLPLPDNFPTAEKISTIK
jgi:type 1 glutamine amidotransferase